MTPEYIGPERRHPDPIQQEIEEAIRLAADPKDRAFLLIMNKIAGNLEENTSLTRSLSADLKTHAAAFTAHEEKEMALINQSRGFFRGAIIGLMAVQGLVLWYGQKHVSEFERLQAAVVQVTMDMAAHKVHHATEEAHRK